jgi:hypothetical protein
MNTMFRRLLLISLLSLSAWAFAQSSAAPQRPGNDPCSAAWKSDKAAKQSFGQRIKDEITTVPCIHLGSGGCLTDTPQAPNMDTRPSGSIESSYPPCYSANAFQSTSPQQGVPDAPVPQPDAAPKVQKPAPQPDPADPASRPDWKPSADDQYEKKSLGQRVKDEVTTTPCVHVGVGGCINKPKPKVRTSKSDDDSSQQPGPGPNQKAPRSDDQGRSLNQDGESSSRSSIVDLSPPKDDARNHPESSTGLEQPSDVAEMKKWDPHRAAKNVEVGDYYFKQKNFVAAESRYQEALVYKDNFAEAMFKLAVTEEKLERADDARRYYELYLKTLPGGDHAQESRSALTRLAGTNKAQ